jgi:hypothetical protein
MAQATPANHDDDIYKRPDETIFADEDSEIIDISIEVP